MTPSRCHTCGDTSRTLHPHHGHYRCRPCHLKARAERENIATRGGALTHQRLPQHVGIWESMVLDVLEGRTPEPPGDAELAALANAESRVDPLWGVVGRDEVTL